MTSQIVYNMLPGKNPQNLFLCLGKYPTKYAGMAVKVNTSVVYLVLLSFLAHVIAGIRINPPSGLPNASGFQGRYRAMQLNW